MFSTAIVAFREILEVSLILGIILAATKELPGRWKWVYAGISGGVIGSILLAWFAEAIASVAEGMGQELFNACVLFTAAAMIGWTVVWMQKHGRVIAEETRKMAKGVVEGKLPHYSVAVVIALASLREGSEIVLFTYSMMTTGIPVASIITGLVCGFCAGAAAGTMLYFGLITIPTRYFFSVTCWLLVMVASGMASLAAKYCVQAGYFSGVLALPVWDSSFLLSEQSYLGQMIHAMLGYTARPLGIQIVFYIGSFLLIALALQKPKAKNQNLATTRAAVSAIPTE